MISTELESVTEVGLEKAVAIPEDQASQLLEFMKAIDAVLSEFREKCPHKWMRLILKGMADQYFPLVLTTAGGEEIFENSTIRLRGGVVQLGSLGTVRIQRGECVEVLEPERHPGGKEYLMSDSGTFTIWLYLYRFEAFHGKIQPGYRVTYKDGNFWNGRVDNLEAVPQSWIQGA